MSKIPMSIEIVSSTNKRLSSMSLDSRLEVKRILSEKYSDVRITDVRAESDLDRIIARSPDLVFLGMKSVPGDTIFGTPNVWLSQRLSEAGIAYTGSDHAAAMLEHNKQLAKERVLDRGLATAQSQLINCGQAFVEQDITVPYPIFIKPVDGGGGSGINEHSLVHTFDELKKQVAWLTADNKTDALLESYLPGREFSVGLLRQQGTDDFHVMPLELVAPVNNGGARFLSSRIKSADEEQTLEVTDQELKAKLNQLALNAFRALGAQDYGRIDIRLDAFGVPHFLEANLLPSLLKDYGNLPKASMLNIQLQHQDLILIITNLALSRNRVKFMPVDNPVDNLILNSLHAHFLA